VNHVIRVRDGLKNVTVEAQEIPGLGAPGRAAALPGGTANGTRACTGARVIVEFALHIPISPNCMVAVSYDLAGDGSWRECCGIPSHTHSTALPGGLGFIYHYRLSRWIAAAHVMRFERIEDAEIAA
jgi:hypothetical protein